MDAQRLTSEEASRPLSVPAGSCLDDAGVCFLPGFRFWRLRLRSRVSARRGAASTSQGLPRTVFKRALERGNLLVAEATEETTGLRRLEKSRRDRLAATGWRANPPTL